MTPTPSRPRNTNVLTPEVQERPISPPVSVGDFPWTYGAVHRGGDSGSFHVSYGRTGREDGGRPLASRKLPGTPTYRRWVGTEFQFLHRVTPPLCRQKCRPWSWTVGTPVESQKGWRGHRNLGQGKRWVETPDSHRSCVGVGLMRLLTLCTVGFRSDICKFACCACSRVTTETSHYEVF